VYCVTPHLPALLRNFAAQAAAAGALRNLAVNEELEGHLLAAGCVPVLLQLAARPQEDVGVRTAALEGLRCGSSLLLVCCTPYECASAASNE
jgi:hypothetical protein